MAAPLHRPVQRTLAQIIFSQNVRAVVAEQVDDRDVTLERCVVQRRHAAQVSGCEIEKKAFDSGRARIQTS